MRDVREAFRLTRPIGLAHAGMLVAALLLAACGSGRHSEWDDIDYSRIARQNQERENDRAYTPPRINVIGCVDDDLYNCNPSFRR